MHGDDPYGLVNRRGLQEVPKEDIFVSIDEFYSMNHAEPESYDGTHIPTRADMAGYLSSKRKYQNAYDHMAYPLLNKRAQDVIMYLPRGIYNSTLGYWWLNETWRPIFNVEEVPVMLDNLDNEILRIGEGDYTLGNLRICRGLIPKYRAFAEKAQGKPLRGNPLTTPRVNQINFLFSKQYNQRINAVRLAYFF